MKKYILFPLIICFLFTSNSTIIAQTNCTTPPVPIIMNGIAAGLTNHTGTNQVTLEAKDFNIASYSECSTITAYSFSKDVNNTKRTFTCDSVGFKTVEIWVTDENGKQSSALTYAFIQDFFELCSGGSVTLCNNELTIYNGLITTLSNTNEAIVPIDKKVQKVSEDCTGEGVTSFKIGNSDVSEQVFNNATLGTQLVEVQTKIDGNLANFLRSYIVVQPPLSTDNCIPVPILYNGLATSLDSNGMVTIAAAAFDAGSYSNCGGTIFLSYSSDINDTQKTFTCAEKGTASIDIWITDSQTGTQNKINTYILVQDLVKPCPPPCPQNYKFATNETVRSRLYQAADNIIFQNKVNSGVEVTLAAGQSIQLLAGTDIQMNSDFTAKIEACEVNVLRDPIAYPTSKIIQTQTVQSLERIDIEIFPNHFQSQATIRYYLPKTDLVQLELIDFLGRKIRMLQPKQVQSQGWQEIQFNADNLPKGTYFITLRNLGQLQSQKFILIK